MNSMEDKNTKIKDAEVVATNPEKTDAKPEADPKTDATPTANTKTDDQSEGGAATNSKSEADPKSTDTTKQPDSPVSVAPEQSATAAATDATESTEATESAPKFPLLPFVAGVLTALLAWQLYTVVTSTATVSESGYPNPIATVDGEPVDQSLFEQNVSETLAAAAAQGADTTDDAVRSEVEDQALEVIINTRLLVTAATNAGYEATAEEIEERISQLESQFGGTDELDTQLDTLGLTRESLAVDVREQIIVDQLLQSEVLTEGVTASEEEITAVYEELQASGQELPPLESVRDALVAQVEQQKQQAAVETYITELREAADIEINL